MYKAEGTVLRTGDNDRDDGTDGESDSGGADDAAGASGVSGVSGVGASGQWRYRQLNNAYIVFNLRVLRRVIVSFVSVVAVMTFFIALTSH